MLYAQFYQASAINQNEIIEACGDRSVIILDGRYKSETNGGIAADECKKRGYKAWRIFSGETFTRSRPVSQLWYVTSDKPVCNPTWLAAHGM